MTERQLTFNSAENRVVWSAISPDGRSLAYTDSKGLHIGSIETGESHDFSMPPDLQHRVNGVLWFPDGNNLLLGGGEGERGSIWTVSIFGGNPRLVKSPIGKLALSAQGTFIAYLDKDGHQLWVMNANGDNARMVLETKDEQIGTLAWSPDGRRLAYIVNKDTKTIHTILLSGGTPSLVISDVNLLGDPDDAATLLWLPDGRILFSLSEPASDDATNLWGIATDLETGKPTGKPIRITNWQRSFPWTPTVSADGRRLGVVKCHQTNDVFIANWSEDGKMLGTPKDLTQSDTYEHPNGWFSDSRAILFTSYRAGRAQVSRLQLDSQTSTQIVPGRRVSTSLRPVVMEFSESFRLSWAVC